MAKMYALRLLNSGWGLGNRDQSCSPSLTHVTMRHIEADYSDKQILRGVGKIETSVLFIIIKICFFLCSPLLSPHAHIPPPQCWWIQLLKSAICSIIFNYPTIVASVIPLGLILRGNHLLIDRKGQLEAKESFNLYSNYWWFLSWRHFMCPFHIGEECTVMHPFSCKVVCCLLERGCRFQTLLLSG